MHGLIRSDGHLPPTRRRALGRSVLLCLMTLMLALGLAASAAYAVAPIVPPWEDPETTAQRDLGAPNVDIRTQMVHARSVTRRGLGGFTRPALGAPATVTVGEFTVGVDELHGTPKFVRRFGEFLNYGRGRGAVDGEETLRGFIAANPAIFDIAPEVLDNCRKTVDDTTAHNGARRLLYQQTVNGVDAFGAQLRTAVSSSGELAMVASTIMPTYYVARATPALTVREALETAATSAGVTFDALPEIESGPAGDELRTKFARGGEWPLPPEARLAYLPLPDGEMRLCWFVYLPPKSSVHSYGNMIDAVSGEVLLRYNMTLAEANESATYSAFSGNSVGPLELIDSPSPFSPGHNTPLVTQPPLAANQPRSQTLIHYDPTLNPQPSPDGWLNDGETQFSETDAVGDLYAVYSNNIIPLIDRDGDDRHDPPRTYPSAIVPYRDFTSAIPGPDLGADPGTYANFSMMNLFYIGNLVHDRFYALGFNEASGNYQFDNFGRGGIGGDPVFCYVQHGGAILGPDFSNNAFFSPAFDGAPGGLHALVWTDPSPDRDSALDTEVMIHEFTHGLSTRLVDPTFGFGLASLQGAGMGEGWSDFMAISMLAEPGDNPHAVYPVAGYLMHNRAGLQENYYFGIRRYPYCTDLSKNPLTFADIDPTQFSVPLNAQVPRSPIRSYAPALASQIHNQGEVWCSALWQARGHVIDAIGFDGNEVMMRLVVDGLKLTPSLPTFIEARDAIYLADKLNYNGAHTAELAMGFAQRGLGGGASAPVTNTTQGVVESFELPRPEVAVRADVTTGKAPLRVNFVGSVVGPLADGAQVEWDLGNGFVIPDVYNVTFTYATPGTYTARFTARFGGDGSNVTGQATIVINVLDDINEPPQARISVTLPSDDGSLEVQFRSSGTDPDGAIVLHQWNFGDGTFASGQQVTHVFPAAGSYTVQLTVTDDRGAVETTVRTIDVGIVGVNKANLPANAQPNPSNTSAASPCGMFGMITLLMTLLGLAALRIVGVRRR